MAINTLVDLNKLAGETPSITASGLQDRPLSVVKYGGVVCQAGKSVHPMAALKVNMGSGTLAVMAIERPPSSMDFPRNYGASLPSI